MDSARFGRVLDDSSRRRSSLSSDELSLLPVILLHMVDAEQELWAGAVEARKLYTCGRVAKPAEVHG